MQNIFAENKNGKIVVFRVTSEKTGDTRKFVPMVREVARKKRIAKASADAAYDSRRNFNLLRERGIEPAIKLKRGSNTMSLGSPLRRREVVLLKGVGYEGWK